MSENINYASFVLIEIFKQKFAKIKMFACIFFINVV